MLQLALGLNREVGELHLGLVDGFEGIVALGHNVVDLCGACGAGCIGELYMREGSGFVW